MPASSPTGHLRRIRLAQPQISPEMFYAQMNRMLGRGQTGFRHVEEAGCGHFALGGREHDVLPDGPQRRVLKITNTGGFGLMPAADPGSETGYAMRTNTSLPLYLERLSLSNMHFGDDVRVERVSEGGSPVITSQPLIVGDAPDPGDIADCMRGLGFERVDGMDFQTWYHRDDSVAAFDAHRGNFIRTLDGHVLPIDLIILRPEDELRGEIEKRL